MKLDRLRVVLVATRNPLNLGAAARAMSNFGVSHLRVVNPYELAFRDARSAVGASEILASAEEFSTVAEAVSDCSLVVGTTAASRRELQHTLRPLPAAARLIRKEFASGRVALLFGSEKRGLSNSDFSHCHWLLRIPTHDDHRSMNLAQAVAVCLYELVRDAKIPAPNARAPRASSVDLERITAALIDSLYACGYLKPQPTHSSEEKIRRLVRRLGLPAADAATWLGILRQIAWKLNFPKDDP